MATEVDSTEVSGDGAAGDEAPAGHPELRIALVLNGGVSLAVWIGGVIHELNRLRVATRGVTVGSDAWASLAARANRRITIDLIAGTSAGGLNGALLASAIANGRQMTNMKRVWNEVGSLTPGALVYCPGESDEPEPKSMLDGGFVHEKIIQTLDELPPYPNGEVSGEECTLLLTATTLTAEARTALLSTGQAISVRDSRRVYKFVSDSPVPPGSRVNSLAENTCVAAAMRATASFPGAFDPFREVAWPLQGGPEPSADTDLSRPWLIDGGVLDNAPFEPLLEELLRTPISGAQERLLVYVTPSIETLQVNGSVPESTAGPEGGDDDPPPLLAVLQYVAKAFGEPDQRLDHEALAATFERMNLSASQPHTYFRAILFNGAASQEVSLATVAGVGEQLFDLYRVSRREAGIRFIDGVAEGPPYLAPLNLPVSPSAPYPGIPRTFADSTDPWQWGVPSADRILRWIGRALAEEALEGAAGAAYLDAALTAVMDAQRQIRGLAELRHRSVVLPPPEDGELGEPFAGLTSADLTFAQRREWQVLQLATFYNGAAGDGDDATPDTDAQDDTVPPAGVVVTDIMNEVFSTLQEATDIDAGTLRTAFTAIEVIYCCFNWGGQAYDTPRFRYVHLTPAALGADPASPLSPTGPTPPQPGGLTPPEPHKPKLYGELWAHFGAFATDMGRNHDWLWGRLDCAEAIADQLAAGLPANEVAEIKSTIFAEILADEGLSVSAVASGLETVREMNNSRLLGLMGATGEGLRAIDLLLKRAEEVAATNVSGPLFAGLLHAARGVARSKVRSIIRDEINEARLADENRPTLGGFGWRLRQVGRRVGRFGARPVS